jgi:hypothetical protein
LLIDRQAFVSGTAVDAVAPVVAPLFRKNIPPPSASASSRQARFHDRRINFRAGEFPIADVLVGRQPALPMMLPISWMLVGSPVCPLKPMFKPWVGLPMRRSGLEVSRSLAGQSHREIFAEQITALAIAYWPLAARRHQPRTPRGRTVQLMRGRRQRYCGMSLAYPSESCQISQPYVHPPALQKLWSLGHRQ